MKAEESLLSDAFESFYKYCRTNAGEQIYLRDCCWCALHTLRQFNLMILPYQTTRMGFEPTTSAVTGRRSNQLSHQAKSFFLLYVVVKFP